MWSGSPCPRWRCCLPPYPMRSGRRSAGHSPRRYTVAEIRAAVPPPAPPARAGARPPFGVGWMKLHLPRFVTADLSQLHRELIADIRDMHTTRGRRENRIGPRGSGKTVWSTTGYSIYSALEGVEPFILILSGESDQATGLLRDIRDEIETNPSLAAAYPHAAGRGPVWRDNLIKLRNGCMIQARGVGGSIRGLKNLAHRPTRRA